MQVGGGGSAVNQGDTKEQKPGGKSAKEEVLETGFFGFGARISQTGHDVQGDREQFKRQEDHDQIAGARHQHHAADAEEQQDVILAAVDVDGA